MPAIQWPGAIALTLFCTVVAVTAGGLLTGIVVAAPAGQRRRFVALAGGGLVAYWALSSLYVASGVISLSHPFPYMAPLLVGNLALAVGLALSPVGEHLSRLPVVALVAFQAFRLPLEVALHWFAEAGTVPVAMSWGGQNLDVVTPVVGLAILPFVGRYPWLLWPFQLVGVGMLVNIFRLVAQHTPGSPLWLGAGTEPVLLGAFFPFQLIVTVCVFAALLGHGVIFRAMARS